MHRSDVVFCLFSDSSSVWASVISTVMISWSECIDLMLSSVIPAVSVCETDAGPWFWSVMKRLVCVETERRADRRLQHELPLQREQSAVDPALI